MFSIEDKSNLLDVKIKNYGECSFCLDEENKEMNRMLIAEHEKILEKVERGQDLTQKDLDLIRDVNQIHLNDEDDINGHHEQDVVLDKWLETMKGNHDF